MRGLLRFLLLSFLLNILTSQAKEPQIQIHSSTLFLSHGQLIGGLSWGHIIIDVDLNQVKPELVNHTKLLEMTKMAIQDGLKDPSTPSAIRTSLKYMQNQGENQPEKISKALEEVESQSNTFHGHQDFPLFPSLWDATVYTIRLLLEHSC